MTESWVEVNIHLVHKEETNEFIRSNLSDLIHLINATEKVYSWHFFREPEIRLRFQVDDTLGVERKIHDWLAALQGNRYISHFIFGKHGVAGERYTGEEEVWGKLWPTAKKMYQYLSELAIDLIKSRIDDTMFLRRYIHLFFDQLGYEQYQESGKLAEFSQYAMAAHIKEIQLGLIK